LVAATASYLDARARGGEWIVRMEDLDTDREQRGAAASILTDLERFGFEWSGPVWRQSRRTEVYHDALERLKASGWAYPCACSRKEIAEAGRYPGTCTLSLPPGKQPRSWRIRAGHEVIAFEDRLHGAQQQNVNLEVGDFVVFRADGLFAYHLAVVVDDAAQGITDVVRGADLLDSTARQIHVQRLLGLPRPNYLHVPVAADSSGQKLSKQTRAAALDPGRAAPLLCDALRFLGQAMPEELRGAPVGELWSWAIIHWSPAHIPAHQAGQAPPSATLTRS
jgi:glutamyl-Q tRNA(Asp) synthetase